MAECNFHQLALHQHMFTSTGLRRLRCLADFPTSAAAASAGLQQQYEQGRQHQKQQHEQEQHSLLMPALDSETMRLMARLALSTRYHVRPHTRNSLLNGTLSLGDFEIPDPGWRGATHMHELVAMRSCMHATILQLVAAELDSLEGDSIARSCGEARWDRADVLLSSSEAAVSINCPASIQHSKGGRTVTPKPRHSCDSLGNQARLCLLRAHHLIEMLISTSDSCVHHASACRVLREAHMQESATTAIWFLKDRRLMSEALRDASFLVMHADFPPVYLGIPRPGMGFTDTSDMDADSSMDLLYLLLMLKCDTFYVHCTGPKHIVGAFL